MQIESQHAGEEFIVSVAVLLFYDHDWNALRVSSESELIVFFVVFLRFATHIVI